MNLNRVLLAGNITRDIELTYTQGGTALAKFGMAMNRKWSTKDGEKKEETTFVDVSVWGRQAETTAEYLGKGSPVFIEGRLDFSTWEKDGQRRSKLEVVAERVQFLPGKGGERS